MEERGAASARASGWLLIAGLLIAGVLLGRLVLDLVRLQPLFGALAAAFYLAMILHVGANSAVLVRGRVGAEAASVPSRLALAAAMPVALLASALDCMGLALLGCTSECTVLIRAVAPGISLLALLHAFTGGGAWLIATLLLAFGLCLPHCVCRNPVNAWWMDLLGRSPACLSSSFAVILIAGSSLAARRRTTIALILSWGVIGVLIAFWVGHHYFDFPW